jgi:DNA-directed RNA polymerase subunit alpha
MDRTPQQLAHIAKNWRSLIRPLQLEIEDHTRTHARLRCEPLERGFGTTLGVALSQTLRSLRGAAITHVAIEEAPGELAEILLGLKEVVFTSSHAEPVEVRLDRRAKHVAAGDITLVDGVTCCNPGHRICTLASDARIAMTLRIGVGHGYVPAERHLHDLPAGTIAIDALFSPIRRVEFAVANARVGQQTDFDRMTLDVWTSGAIDPIEAVHRAATILQDHAGLFLNFEEVPEPVVPPRDLITETINENLWRTVDELELSVRAENCLRNIKVTYIGELVQKTESDLMKTRGFGRKSLTEIANVLAEMGLVLGMKPDGWPGAKPVDR